MYLIFVPLVVGSKAKLLLFFKDISRRMNTNPFHLLKNKLFGTIPNKRAFLVLGAESNGSHLVTDILINAGCIGHAGNHVPWQPNRKVLYRGIKKPWEYKFPTDLQPWDKEMPTDEDPIVWRRSIPHGKQWINLTKMILDLKERGYQVKAIVVTRDTYAALQSQLKWQHVKNEEIGKEHISQAYLHIFRHLLASGTEYILVNYEAFANYPKAQDFLLEQLGLELPKRRWPVYDGNQKWHDYPSKNKEADFPEAWYPCKVGNSLDYFQKVEIGYQKMRKQELIICGLARDVHDALPAMMKKIELLGKLFKNYKVIIFENDSLDGTYELLQYWQRINPKVEILSEQLHAKKWEAVQSPSRMEQMAAYRNRYLEHIRAKNYAFDYLIVLDLDLPLGFSYDGIAHTFSYEDWDVVGSNGILVPPYGDPIAKPMFYDAFAFRPKNQQEVMDTVTINQLQFQRGDDLVTVESAFGGLAIYSNQAILSGVNYGGADCEHVVFHQALRKRGFEQQFLNPSQLVLYSGKL